MSDAIHPAPHRDRAGFLLLLFGASAAPIFWLGQEVLGYWFVAQSCYPGDHPQQVVSGPAVLMAVVVFDIVAVVAAALGGVVSFWCWQQVKGEKEGGFTQAIGIGDGRTRFLAIWGIMSSLWFFFAIAFNAIASLTVPPCLT
jgi:hypothetical protein